MWCLNIKRSQIVQILAIITASLASIGYGMHYAWSSPSIPKLIADKSNHLTIDEASYFVVIQAVGMALATPLFCAITDKIGRKTSALIAVIPQVIAWIMLACIKHVWLFYLARFIVGIGDAAIYATLPVYVCEISEPEVRNNWSNMIIIGAYFGICAINVMGAEYDDVSATAIVGAVYASLVLAALVWIPESPYYLLMKDRIQDAQSALRRLLMKDNVDAELTKLKSDVKRQMSESGSWKDLFCVRSNRKALALCLGLKVLQQLSGIVAFEVYAVYMFQVADLDVTPSTCAIIFSGTLLCSTTLGLLIVPKFGRRPLLMFSCLGCGVCLAAETAYFALKTYTSVNLANVAWIPLSVMILYVVFCTFGVSTTPITYAGEIFSTSIKSKAIFLNNLVFAVCLLVTPKIFQVLTTSFGIVAPFGLFSACCFVGAILVYAYMIETKDKTLEQIQQELKGAASSVI